ncbi:hypothetical protein NKR23_g193 [Pleurostoma richardsiae]|uniref:Uncharacterized protein n=1 Tax=Pleurostoma richardsiae TaxID=41990 RepID=A0AA38RWC8_9PEZI|nr:hypothetical protein NKR23_g193 [Pleurostoma richardsiae]
MASQALEPRAEYGRLAFDVFLVEKWDYAADHTTDKQQWEALARQYLALTPLQRFPFHREVEARHKTETYAVSPDLAARLFAPHQTAQERNLLALRASRDVHDAIWLRTCYDPSLADAYDALAEHVIPVSEPVIERPDGAFDDSALYQADDEEDGLSKFLLRVPELFDLSRCRTEKQFVEQERQASHAGDEDLNVEGFVYLVDRQALEEGVLKVCWVDTHGVCVWWNKIEPEGLLDLTGKWEATCSMAEVVSCAESEEKGAMLWP